MLFSNILVAYDGSDSSEKALSKAIELAGLIDGCKLNVLHVYQLPSYVIADGLVTASAGVSMKAYNHSEDLAEQAKMRVLGMPNAEVTVMEGPPARVIIDFAAEQGSDLIVLGSRGMGALSEFVLGSVSHNVTQHAAVPVLVVK